MAKNRKKVWIIEKKEKTDFLNKFSEILANYFMIFLILLFWRIVLFPQSIPIWKIFLDFYEIFSAITSPLLIAIVAWQCSEIQEEEERKLVEIEELR